MKPILSVVAFCLFLLACKKDDNTTNNSAAADIIYIETNNYMDNQNAILAYRHLDDGSMTLMGTYPTNGSGVGNPMQVLGPLDSETQLKITADRKYLLAVNSGSNTIAVFKIAGDGLLTAVAGSPFPSSGETPVSIDIYNGYVYVVNKSQDFAPNHTVAGTPNYTVFSIDVNGALSQVPASTITTTPGVSPSQILVSHDGRFAFGDEFLGFMLNPPKGTLRSFSINGSNGMLSPVDTPMNIPDMGGALGLWQHPTQNIVYVGFPLAGKVGVYAIDQTTGKLNFQTSTPAGLAACWLRTAQNGNRLYCLNSGENTVSMYNTTNASAPTSLGSGKLALKQPGPDYTVNIMGMNVTLKTSEPFAFEFSPKEKFLYVVNQHTNPSFAVGNYNYFHVLDVAADGTLIESTDPVQLPVDNMYRPQGVVVHRIE